MSNNDQDFQNALVRARDEFSILTFGKEKSDVLETLELREHAKKRTDLSKKEQDLTPDQRAWKLIYKGIDSELKTLISEKEMADLDEKKDLVDEIGEATRNLGKLIELGKKIEISLFNERIYSIISNPHRVEKSNYFERYDQVCELMLKKDDTEEKHLEYANTAIKLVNVFKDIALTNLEKEHEESYVLLSEFEAIYQQTNFERLNGSERDAQHSENIAKLSDLFQKWIELTKEIRITRAMAITAVKRRLESDLVLPNRTIQRNGDVSGNLTEEETEAFNTGLTSSATLFITSSEKEKKISETRDSICQELYGPNEKYLPQGEEKSEDIAPIAGLNPQNPLEGKTWFRLAKVVYIGLCLLVGLLVLLILAMSAFEAAFWTTVIGAVIMIVTKKAFYYIALGRTDWKK